MPKLRRSPATRSAKTIAVHICCKLGGRKGKTGVAQLSNDALITEAKNIKRTRDTHKITSEMRKRGLQIVIEDPETIEAV